MKSLKVLTGIAIASVGLTAAVTVGVVNQRQNNGLLETKAATFVYDASSVTTRRIYFVNNDNGGYWYRGWNLEAQVWYGETYSGWVATTEIYDNYYYCVDFESNVAGFLGGDLHIEFRVKTGEESYAYTKTCYNIPALNNKAFDVIYIDNGKPVIGTTLGVGDNIAIIGCVLDHYETCEQNYASGFYGYPQLYKDFIEQNQTEIDNSSATITDKDEYGVDQTYTVKAKIKQLKDLYDANGWTVA